MVSARIMDIACARLPLDSSLLVALKVLGGSGASAVAVVDAGGRFVGSLSAAALVAELASAGWHCGTSTMADSLAGTAGVGIASLVDRETVTVGPEVPFDEVARLLVGSDGLVAVVDNAGALLGTITHAGLIATLLAVAEAE